MLRLLLLVFLAGAMETTPPARSLVEDIIVNRIPSVMPGLNGEIERLFWWYPHIAHEKNLPVRARDLLLNHGDNPLMACLCYAVLKDDPKLFHELLGNVACFDFFPDDIRVLFHLALRNDNWGLAMDLCALPVAGLEFNERQLAIIRENGGQDGCLLCQLLATRKLEDVSSASVSEEGFDRIIGYCLGTDAAGILDLFSGSNLIDRLRAVSREPGRFRHLAKINTVIGRISQIVLALSESNLACCDIYRSIGLLLFKILLLEEQQSIKYH